MNDEKKRLCINYAIKAIKAILPIASAFLASLLTGSVDGIDEKSAVLVGGIVGNILNDVC